MEFKKYFHQRSGLEISKTKYLSIRNKDVIKNMLMNGKN